MTKIVVTYLVCVVAFAASDTAERKVDPTFLRRHIPDVAARASDISTDSCKYKPLFGEGDPDVKALHGVRRFGEATVAARGSCAAISYPDEEQVYVITEGGGTIDYGGEKSPVKVDDFMYLAPGVRHSLSNSGTAPLRFFVMGFRVPRGLTAPGKLQIANISETKPQTVGGHPDSVLYRLMLGDTSSKRDRLASAHLITSLFLMEFQPGGTNFPHHHDNEEEIYVLLSGTGDMVAGGGMNGVEARFPATPGDAYFFRLNTTVGFYSSLSGPARILAVRSTYPRSPRQ